MDYIAIIHKNKDSDYTVSFPDFDGCITGGKTIDEAKDMAHEALEFHIEGMIEDGEDLPAPSSVETIMKHPDFADGVAFLVSIPNKTKTVRVNITMDEKELQEIDRMAKALGMSRSAYLVRQALSLQ